MNNVTDFLSLFGEAGLVFTLMAVAVYFLSKAYLREKKENKETQVAFNKYVIETQKHQIETISSFTSAMDRVSEQLKTIEQKI